MFQFKYEFKWEFEYEFKYKFNQNFINERVFLLQEINYRFDNDSVLTSLNNYDEMNNLLNHMTKIVNYER